jgi:hypothetical protein
VGIRLHRDHPDRVHHHRRDHLAGGTRAALLTGAAACLVAAGIAALVRTPPHPDAALTDLVPQREPR